MAAGVSMNGCFNHAPYPKLIPLPSVYHINVEGHHVLCDAVEMIPNVFTTDCQFTKTQLGREDKGCIGCSWRLDD